MRRRPKRQHRFRPPRPVASVRAETSDEVPRRGQPDPARRARHGIPAWYAVPPSCVGPVRARCGAVSRGRSWPATSWLRRSRPGGPRRWSSRAKCRLASLTGSKPTRRMGRLRIVFQAPGVRTGRSASDDGRTAPSCDADDLARRRLPAATLRSARMTFATRPANSRAGTRPIDGKACEASAYPTDTAGPSDLGDTGSGWCAANYWVRVLRREVLRAPRVGRMTIGGDPDEIRDEARRLRHVAESTESQALTVRRGEGVHWHGRAGDRYRERLAEYSAAIRRAMHIVGDLVDPKMPSRLAASRTSSRSNPHSVVKAPKARSRSSRSRMPTAPPGGWCKSPAPRTGARPGRAIRSTSRAMSIS